MTLFGFLFKHLLFVLKSEKLFAVLEQSLKERLIFGIIDENLKLRWNMSIFFIGLALHHSQNRFYRSTPNWFRFWSSRSMSVTYWCYRVSWMSFETSLWLRFNCHYQKLYKSVNPVYLSLDASTYFLCCVPMKEKIVSGLNSIVLTNSF